ncbi:MAG: SRPBCC domain-containing protein [Planctomycetaceae bacterium]|nr:SRPBCC domain-containing protein [Planctomycetaceae bacterium]
MTTLESRVGAARPRQRLHRPMARNGDGRSDRQLGLGLGLFSIGLGMAEIFAPRVVARMIGVRENRPVIRAVGVREVVNGIGLLVAPNAPALRWARVAGDIMDLALLGSSFSRRSRDREKTATAAVAVLGVTAVDLAAGASGERSDGRSTKEGRGPIKAIVTVNQTPEVCYQAWSDPAVLERVVADIESIRPIGDGKTRWTMRCEGETAEWDSEYTEQVPSERLAWKSHQGGKIKSRGIVTFDPAPGGRGTVVRLEMNTPNSGHLSGKMFGKVKAQRDLLRFKQYVELGFIPSNEGQPSGPRGMIGKMFQKAEEEKGSPV